MGDEFRRFKEENKKENFLKKFWNFLKEDTWQSWIVSLILLIILIRFIFFPLLSFATGSSLPLVIVESCSMYHGTDFDSWWNANKNWYEARNISKEKFESFPLKNGFDKGDIIFVIGRVPPKIGDVIVFRPNSGSTAKNAIIHRTIALNPLGTKGDNNQDQFRKNSNPQNLDETEISQNQVVGKSVFRIPAIGWVKLIFFEPLREPSQRGFCR